MQIYDWLLLALAAAGVWVGISAMLTGLRGFFRREYGGAIMFLILGVCFSLAGFDTAYVATLGKSPDA